jgi:hypothetical protein
MIPQTGSILTQKAAVAVFAGESRFLPSPSKYADSQKTFC